MTQPPPITHHRAISDISEMTTLGMSLVRSCHARATTGPEPAPPRRDPIDQFNAACATVIRAHILLAKLQQQTAHREQMEAAAEADRRRAEARAAEDAELENVCQAEALVRHYVRRMVGLSIVSPRNHQVPPPLWESLVPAFSSRGIDAGLATRSVTEHVGDICEELGITPDFSYWTAQDLMLIDAGGLPANPPPVPAPLIDGTFDLPPNQLTPQAELEEEEDDPDPFWRVPVKDSSTGSR